MPSFRSLFRAAEWWWFAGLTLLTVALFWQVHAFDFVNFDDPEYITENQHVKAGLRPESVLWALTSLDADNWFPLTWLSLELDATLYGLNPAGFHVTNLALHVANTLLLFWALRTMTGAVLRSACVAALFAIHPLHVESVAWISERKDVLSTLFWMLTMLAYARYASRPSLGRYSLVVVAFALGLTAKSMLVTLPCVLLQLDFWPLRRWPAGDHQGEKKKQKGESAAKDDRIRSDPKSEIRNRKSEIPLTPCFPPATWRRLIVEKLPLLALSAACSLVTAAAQSKGGTMIDIDSLPLDSRFANAIVVYVAYLANTIWPLELANYYPYPPPTMGTVIVAAALLLATSVWICRRRRTQPYLAVGWFWYLGTLVPVIGLVQVGTQAMADRYTYIPLVGIFVALVWGLGDLVAGGRVSRRLVTALAAVAFTGFALCTWAQIGYWRDGVTLWEHAIEVGGPSHVSCCGLGMALKQRGQCQEALPWLRKATTLAPNLVEARENLGAVLFELGRNSESRLEFETLVRLAPRHAKAHRALGALYWQEDDLGQAASHLRAALAIDPNDWQAQWGLGEVLVKQGKGDEGRHHLDEAARRTRNHETPGLEIDRDAAEHY